MMEGLFSLYPSHSLLLLLLLFIWSTRNLKSVSAPAMGIRCPGDPKGPPLLFFFSCCSADVWPSKTSEEGLSFFLLTSRRPGRSGKRMEGDGRGYTGGIGCALCTPDTCTTFLTPKSCRRCCCTHTRTLERKIVGLLLLQFYLDGPCIILTPENTDTDKHFFTEVGFSVEVFENSSWKNTVRMVKHFVLRNTHANRQG